MNVLDLIFRANTGELDKAEKKLDQVEKKATAAEKSASKLGDAFDGFNQIGGPIGEVANTISDMKDRVDGAVKSVVAFGASAGLAVTAVTALAGAAGVLAALRFTGTLDDLDDLAKKLGLNATQTLLMKQEFEDAGVAVESYTGAINRAAKTLAKADDEAKAASEALETLGINAKEATTPQELLNRLTDEYGKKLEEGKVTVGESAALQLVLGKNYKETMIAVEAAKSAQERYNGFAKAGIGISVEGLAATGDFTSANKDMQYVLKVVGSQLVGEVVPAFTGLINALVDSYKNGGLVKIAFEGIRAASQLVMIPIRAMFNAFIQLDAAIQTVGKGIGAVFAAIATRSTEPLKALKADIEAIWTLANSRTTGPWSWDNGGTQGAGAGNAPSGGSGGNGKKGKTTAFEDTPEYKEALRDAKERAAARKKEYEGIDDYFKDQYIKQVENQRKEIEQLERLRQTYVDLIDPLEKYRKQIEEIQDLRAEGMLTAEEALQAEIKIQAKMQETLDKTKDKAKDSFNFMERIGQSAFKRLEDTLVGFAEGGKITFKSLAQSIISDLFRIVVQMKIIQPLTTAFTAFMKGGSFLSTLTSGAPTPSANGNVFGPSGMLYSANGNVFDGPTLHGYRGGLGVLGEKGPEAIMPLKRGANGVLGVQVTGGSAGSQVSVGGIYVTVEGGNTSEQTGEAIGSAAAVAFTKAIVRAELANQQRYGGILNR